ncbi:hypothetical protein C8R47DRAFT_1081438 [Mycena vitilis]|nr:hypothetical protein C8R47DRAFT_1081438 [Mycena vitilis]
MPVVSQSIASQAETPKHGMQVISERLGGNDTTIGLPNFSDSLAHATKPTGPFSCPSDHFWTACVPNRIIPLVGITVILLVLIITPILVHYEGPGENAAPAAQCRGTAAALTRCDFHSKDVMKCPRALNLYVSMILAQNMRVKVGFFDEFHLQLPKAKPGRLSTLEAYLRCVGVAAASESAPASNYIGTTVLRLYISGEQEEKLSGGYGIQADPRLVLSSDKHELELLQWMLRAALRRVISTQLKDGNQAAASIAWSRYCTD